MEKDYTEIIRINAEKALSKLYSKKTSTFKYNHVDELPLNEMMEIIPTTRKGFKYYNGR